MKNHDPPLNNNKIERLFSHNNKNLPLDKHYNKPLDTVLHEEFDKAILALTVDPTQRQKAELERKQKKIDDLEEKNHRITTLESDQIKLRDVIDSLVDELAPRVHEESAVRKEQEAIESFENEY